MNPQKLLTALIMVLAIGAQNASAVPMITLDFDSAATGADLMTTPLVTAFGTITLSNATAIQPTDAGSGDGVLHDQSVNSGFARFDFDFDVLAIDFTYSGQGGGVFTGEVLDIGDAVLESIFNPDTSSLLQWGPVTLGGTGTAIRAFRFADEPGGGALSSVDNLVIIPVVAAVPEPSTVVLMGVGLAGLGFTRRKMKA